MSQHPPSNAAKPIVEQREAHMSALAAVRSRTAELHHALEALPINTRLLAEDFTLVEYQGMLLRMYGFHEPLARSGLRADATWAGHAARRVGHLADDLFDLGASRAQLLAAPHCTALPSLETPDRALGCGYVLEGSTLGGRVIGRHLTKIFSRELGVPLRFFTGDGEDTGPNWRRFCTEFEASTNDIDEVCAGASATFGALAAWLAPSATNAERMPP